MQLWSPNPKARSRRSWRSTSFSRGLADAFLLRLLGYIRTIYECIGPVWELYTPHIHTYIYIYLYIHGPESELFKRLCGGL